MAKKFQIMLVDDHQVIIDGLSILLPTVIDCSIISTALNGEEAIKKLKQVEPDLIIMDLIMPGKYNGVNATRKIKELYPEIKILCLSMMSDAASIAAVLSAGANGYTVKNSTGDELKEAIEFMSRNETYIHPSLMNFFAEGVRAGSIRKNMIVKDMDIVILQSIAQGLTAHEIGKLVFRSEETIRSRRKQMLKRFSVNNSAELVAYALRNKFIE